jgi:DNA-directed RNA polymerase specialized sigma24 family protein
MQEGKPSAASWQALAAVRNDAIRSLRRRAIDAGDAEDHVHEAIVRLGARGLTDLEPARVRGLLIRAAWGIAVDHHRRSDRHRRLLPRLLDVGAAPAADEMVAEHSEARWLAARLGGLGAMERSALVLAAWGRGVEEIAVLLGVDYKAAANALARARRKLRLLATSVSIWLAGALRRIRHADQTGAAVAASAVAAMLLLVGPARHGDAGPAPASRPPTGVIVLRPDQMRVVSSHSVIASGEAPLPHAPAVASRPSPAPSSTPRPSPPSSTPPPLIPLPAPLPTPPQEPQGRCSARGCVNSILPGTPAEPVMGTVYGVAQHPFWLRQWAGL